jgi:hypothetical protein
MTAASTTSHTTLRHRLLLATLSVLVGLAAILLALELVLRLLPVSTGLRAMPVNADSPVFRFAPRRDFVHSRGWNFRGVTRGRTNNAGFLNGRDYDPAATDPLLAIVGDSYVEAQQVPFADSTAGRLAACAGPARRVYSLAASGAPLSQYLVWARHARDTWAPAGFVIVVVGNDFDESLISVKDAPGFHYFDDRVAGPLALRRIDYRPGSLRRVGRHSSLARYVMLNLRAPDAFASLASRLAPIGTAQAGPSAREIPAFVGNTSADAGAARVLTSLAVIDAFLTALPQATGVPPASISIVLDGIRPALYRPENLRGVADSYWARMRMEMQRMASARGFELLDLQPLFIAAHQATGQRFEFPDDSHWNANGHAVAAQAIGGSSLGRRILPDCSTSDPPTTRQ